MLQYVAMGTSVKAFIVDLFAAVAYWSGLDALFYWLNRKSKRILTFHNVLDNDVFREGVANGVSSKLVDFERIVDECAKRFRFSTDLADLSTLTVTFDDGYLNQYAIAFKSLKRRGIPAYLFVSGDAHSGLIVDRLLHWVAEAPIELIPGGDRMAYWSEEIWPRFVADSKSCGADVLNELSAKYPYEKILSELPKEYVRQRLTGISGEELAEMRAAGWKIGWHTQSHFPLSKIDDAAQERELASDACYRSVCFSFPYGNSVEVGERAVAKVRELGYPCAVSNTTSPGEPYSRYFLPRMALDSRKYRLHFELSGFKHFLKFRKLLPRVEPWGNDAVCPDFDELIDLAKVRGEEILDIRIESSGKLCARALMHAETRRHHGVSAKVLELYTGKLHDYSKIYAVDAEAAGKLWRRIVEEAKRLKCDLISIDNVLAETVPDALPWRLRRELKIFDASLADWAAICGRKSMKRFVRDANKSCKYHVETNAGNLPHGLVSELGELHVRRWRFDYSGSPFESGGRDLQYLNHPQNKVYLRIMDGEDIIACHYGMVYGKTLLWHTPVINPKYLKLSPLRILLYETARYCKMNGIERIDFGLGEEEYKDGYCNAYRNTLHFEKAVTIRGFASKTIGMLYALKVSAWVVDVAKRFLRCLRARARSLRERWDFYFAEGEVLSANDVLFRRIDTWAQFCDFAKQRDFPIYKWQFERFHRDDTVRFVCLADEHEVFTFGWETMRTDIVKHFPAKLEGRRVLFDFCTPEGKRNKGWYKRLLGCLVSEGGGVIYVNPHNLPSVKAIKASGFVKG